MNTIPTTFNYSLASYTAVGGDRRAAATGLSAVILNRGGRYLRRNLFQELEKIGFDQVVSIEGPRETWDVEELATRFPFVRFLLLKEQASLGAQINLAAAETTTERFFVLWNDLRLIQGGGAARIAERLSEAESATTVERGQATARLCTIPTIQNARFETLPTLVAPAFFRGGIKTIPFASTREGTPTLYPFDAAGIYDKDRFVKMGGFDGSIASPYWQLMDFGFRAQLWGEVIRSTQLVKLAYDGDAPAENATIDESYKSFYLKNLAPVYRGDCAHIPLRRFPSFLLRAGGGPIKAWEDFAEARRWVETNRFRFTCDARKVIELWETPES
jgi:hypothetical protein